MENKKILILDDNEDILVIVAEVLAYENYNVRAISHAATFFEVAAEFKPDLVLLDFKLGPVDGGQLCIQFKARPEFSSIPVVIFTAYGRPGLNLKTYGCEAVIAKPFDLEEFAGTIEKLLTPQY